MKYWFVSFAAYLEFCDQYFDNTVLAFEEEYFPIIEATEKIRNSCVNGTQVDILFFQEVSHECYANYCVKVGIDLPDQTEN